MTGLLKSVMHERVDAVDTPHLDVDAMISNGNRRVRRTRVAGAVTGVAAVAVLAAVVPFAAGQWSTADAPAGPAGAPAFAEREPSYAAGSAIHHGDQVIQVGVGIQVQSYVQTDDGFVFTTQDGDVAFTDGESTEHLGTTSKKGFYLKADDQGSLAAWVEFPQGEAPRFVVYDTAERARVVETSEGNRPGMTSFRDTDAAYIYAVDDGNVYWRSGDGAVRYDVGTGASEVLDPNANPFDIEDVANDQIAHNVETNDPAAYSNILLAVSRDLSTPAEPLPKATHGVLSPSATYVATDASDEMAVYDVATRQDVSPSTDGYAFVAAYGWLDDSTVMMVGLETSDQSQPIDLLRCTVPAGKCTVAVDDAATSEDLVIPVGERLG